MRDTVTQDFLFRTTEASTICLAIEFYVGKCMAKLEVLAGKFLEENRAQKSKSELVVDPVATKRDTAMPKLQTQLVREHPIETVSLAPVGSPDYPQDRSAEMPAQATPKENVLNGSLSTVGVNAVPTATETGCVKDGIVSPTALDQRSDALPLLILEDPVRETMPTNFPLTILYGSPSDNSTMTTIDTIVDEPQTMQESTCSLPITHLRDTLNDRHDVDTSDEDGVALGILSSEQQSHTNSMLETWKPHSLLVIATSRMAMVPASQRHTKTL